VLKKKQKRMEEEEEEEENVICCRKYGLYLHIKVTVQTIHLYIIMTYTIINLMK